MLHGLLSKNVTSVVAKFFLGNYIKVRTLRMTSFLLLKTQYMQRTSSVLIIYWDAISSDGFGRDISELFYTILE